MSEAINYGAQKVRLDLPTMETELVEFLLQQANKLANCAIYGLRQSIIWFGRTSFHLEVVKNELQTEFKENIHYTILHSQAAQSVLHKTAENFYGYQNSLIAYWNGQNPIKPRMPHYRKKGGLHEITYPSQALKKKYDEDGQAILGLPLGWDIKKLYWEDMHQIDYIWIPYPTNINPDDIIEVTLSPQNGELYAIFVYKLAPVNTVSLDYSLALGIDHGVNNWLTCVPNTGKKGFVVDGRQLKQFNQFYHKQVSKAKTDKPQGFWSGHLDRITAKRNRRMHDATNKAARVIIDYCLAQGIGNIVFGWNKGQSQSTHMGRQNNQSFSTIPTGKLKERLHQLCELYGIRFIETEESYTSKSSFFDNDALHVFGEKPESWKPSGKREKRGLYVTAKGYHISSDANGACNILRKIAPSIGVSLSNITIKCCQFLERIYLWKRSCEQHVKAPQLAAKAIGAL
ncbi:RNA-guided endonuclease TnpB family protein [Aetokthonos hydrillicola Thurmond2011]|uniref:RNA-guided endonuclease TnpB family protein n=1 Tax=Aetokthonos hydrillicola Thurmond2011 TaxID=2712845 RepID=A0AAP5ID16_9CYAN|nr:transposase [Aetokthonos hydrillicola]MBW4590783.1 transposase [Aetokthonos hydrillicola CCALA 1050]MDR9898044.1 RNA-guided endonuclease TnpB family protein [Aetokthonos hydrillicola Thurmond2011]